jgi:hypothetical protein
MCPPLAVILQQCWLDHYRAEL